jgi:hypothetical protein
MFDFLRWRQFISDRADELRRDGFATELRLSDHSPKPGTALNVSGQETLAYFSNWNTGEADYEIMGMTGELILSQSGLLLDDGNFQSAFDAFAEAVRSNNPSNK